MAHTTPTNFSLESLLYHESMLLAHRVKQFIYSKNFNVLHLNVRSLADKYDELMLLIRELDVEFSCIVITETWFSEFDFLDQYFIPGFDLFCNSRVGKCGGGVCFYV